MHRPMNRFQFTGVRFYIALILILGWFSAADAQRFGDRAFETVPGQLIIKIESDESIAMLQKQQPGQSSAPFNSRTILQEVERELQIFGLDRMDRVMNELSFQEIRMERMQPGRTTSGVSNLPLSDDLTRTWFVHYQSDVDPFYVASKIRQIPGVAYAEPRVLMELFVTPNDPLFGQNGQNYFEAQRFPQAWDLTTSSRDIIISIVDSGVDYNHPDLRDNLWRNPEPGRAAQMFPGIFSQVQNDTIGWNFWESGPSSNAVQNGNPIGTAQSHGTHVAGIAAAISDNGVGIASSGFNSTYMAVRVGGTEDQPSAIGFGYEGILYSAINGAHVINCSFGSDFRSSFGEDVVNFATQLGSVVVGAAGNSNNDVSFYPAAFDNVLSVASVVTGSGVKSSFSSFGYYVDVASTGTGILSTVFNGQYALNSGTSMASPVVAGLVALVRDRFPDWSPERIIGQIRGTANPTIYAVNPNHRDKLGGGLADAFRAVTASVPYIRLTHVRFIEPDGSKLGMNTQGFIEIDYTNFGATTQSLAYEITLVNDTAILGLNNGSITSVSTDASGSLRIPVTITDGVLTGAVPRFRIRFRDTSLGYDDFRYIQYENLFVDTHETGKLTVSATSNGAVGFNRTPDAISGVGFVPFREVNGQLLQLQNMLYESGIMIELNIDEQVHMITNVRETNYPDPIFRPLQLFEISETPNGQAGYARMVPDLKPNMPGLELEMQTFAFSDPQLNQSLLVYYTIHNVDPSRLAFNDVYVGLFADWDIANYSNNQITYRAIDSLMVVRDPGSSAPLASVAHLGGISSAFAINNAYTGEVDSLNFGIYFSPGNATFNGFTRQYKSWSMRAGLGKVQQFETDVSQVVASGPFTVRYQQKITVGFVFSFGNTEEELAAQVAAARQRNVIATTPNFNSPRVPVFIPDEIAISGNYPNPFNPSTTILIDMARPGRAVLEVYDVLGRRLDTIFDGMLNNRRYEITFNAANLSSGVYIVVLRTDQGIRTRKVTLMK